MLTDLMHSYMQGNSRSSGEMIISNHQPKPGLYIRINLERGWQEQVSEFHDNHLFILPQEEQTPASYEKYGWFQAQDYYSSLVSMNKAVDKAKQIHNSHPFALFAKGEVFLERQAAAKHSMADNIVRFLNLTEPEQIQQRWMELVASGQADRKRKQITPEAFFPEGEYAEELAYLQSEWRQKHVAMVRDWYAYNLQTLIGHVDKEYRDNKRLSKMYIKLFFTMPPESSCPKSYTTEQAFLYEYILYTLPKIFNSNEYNQLVDRQIYGLPGFNMSMNSKKPYLVHKTMCVRIPMRISLQEAIEMKQMSEWLLSRPKYTMNRLYYESTIHKKKVQNPEGAYHVYVDGKDNEIFSFENVPFSAYDSLNIHIENVTRIKEGKTGELKLYEPIRTVEQLQKEVSRCFFRGRMNQEPGKFLLGEEPKPRNKDFTSGMGAIFMQSRQAFHDWFFKATEITIRPLFGKLTMRLIEEQMLYVESDRQETSDSLNFWQLSHAFNIRISLMEHLNPKQGGKGMADRISQVRSILRERLDLHDIQICTTDEEFYYLAGQIAFYLKSQSEAQDKRGDLLEPLLAAKRSQQLKRRLEEAYFQYKHKIVLNYPRFNRSFASLYSYKPEFEPDGEMRDMFMAGLFSDNWFYEKQDNKNLNNSKN